MKIFRNAVQVNIDLEEFLELVDSDRLEDLIITIMELDDESMPTPKIDLSRPTKVSSLPRDPQTLEEDEDGYLVIEDMDSFIEALESGELGMAFMPISDEELEALGFGSFDEGLSQEDKKIRRVIQRYNWLTE